MVLLCLSLISVQINVQDEPCQLPQPLAELKVLSATQRLVEACSCLDLNITHYVLSLLLCRCV